MGDCTLYNISPYQFRIAHDINLDNFPSPTEDISNGFLETDINAGPISPAQGGTNGSSGLCGSVATQLAARRAFSLFGTSDRPDPPPRRQTRKAAVDLNEINSNGIHCVGGGSGGGGAGGVINGLRRVEQVSGAAAAAAAAAAVAARAGRGGGPALVKREYIGSSGSDDGDSSSSGNSNNNDNDNGNGRNDTENVESENNAAKEAESATADQSLPCRPTRKVNNVKRKRRPRKLPEIPADAPRKSVAYLIRAHSLAEELSGAGHPSICRDSPTPRNGILQYSASSTVSSTTSSPSSFNANVHPFVSLQDLGSPEYIDVIDRADSGYFIDDRIRSYPNVYITQCSCQVQTDGNGQATNGSDCDKSTQSDDQSPGSVDHSVRLGCENNAPSGGRGDEQTLVANGGGRESCPASSTIHRASPSNTTTSSTTRSTTTTENTEELGKPMDPKVAEQSPEKNPVFTESCRGEAQREEDRDQANGHPGNMSQMSPPAPGSSHNGAHGGEDERSPADPYSCQSLKEKSEDEDLSEFSEHSVFLDDEPKSAGCLSDEIPIAFNVTAGTSKAFLSSNNTYLLSDSSPEEHPDKLSSSLKTKKKEIITISEPRRHPSASSTYSGDVDDLEATHRGCHKFVPRHSDEMFIEIGDPIYVEAEDDDLWCEGVNMRTGKKGIFPAAYATDLFLLEGEAMDGSRPFRFTLRFLGSVEVNHQKGNEVLCQAINKVALARRMTQQSAAAPLYLLEINEYGIRMIDKSKKKTKKAPPSPKKEASFKQKLVQMLSKVKEAKGDNNHFFSLKNVAFCGYHPKNDRYFAFITKHPLELRFACHVFISERSTRPIAEAVGEAFRRFYQEYMAFVHPTEDIYIE